ncbi:MAG: hypothetical protein QXF25_02990, partial [Candidatus Pacearchaeota archaeon]
MKTYLLFENNDIINSLKRYCNYVLDIKDSDIKTFLNYKIKNGYIEIDDLSEDARIISSLSINSKEEIMEKICTLFAYQLRKRKNLYLNLIGFNDFLLDQTFNNYYVSISKLSTNLKNNSLYLLNEETIKVLI